MKLTVKTIGEPTPPPKVYVLELDEKEAKSLYLIMGHIQGVDDYGIRKTCNDLYYFLDKEVGPWDSKEDKYFYQSLQLR